MTLAEIEGTSILLFVLLILAIICAIVWLVGRR